MSASDSEEFESANEDDESCVKSREQTQIHPVTETVNISNAETLPCQPAQTQVKPCEEQSPSINQQIKIAKPGGSSYWSTSSWSSWSQSVLSVAQSSVISLAHQVNEGLHVVSQSVEKVLDAPPPELLAAENHLSTQPEEIQCATTAVDTSVVSESCEKEGSSKINAEHGECTVDGDKAWWNTVSTTGLSLASGGLNVLESIGKKTMEKIQETDPGLKKTKSLLKPNMGPSTLSQALREAQAEQAENSKRSPSTDPSPTMCPPNECTSLKSKEAVMNKLREISEDCHSRNVSKLATQSREEVQRSRQVLHLIRERVSEFASKDFNEDGGDKSGSASAHSRDLITMESELAQLLEGLQIRQIQKLVMQRRNRALAGNNSSVDNKADTGSEQDVVPLSHETTPQQLFSQFATEMSEFSEGNSRLCLGVTELLLLRACQIQDWTLFINSLYNVLMACALDVKTLSQKYVMLTKEKRNATNRREVGQSLTNIFLETENGFTSIKDLFSLLQPILSFSVLRSVDVPAR